MKFQTICEISQISEICENQLLEFDFQILSLIDLEIKSCFPESLKINDFTIQNKIALRELLNKAELNIKDFRDGSQEISFKLDKIAFWKKPIIEYKSEKDKVIVMINFEYWTVFDDN